MATNKNAQIRYQALDRCLSNWSRRYYIDDLVEACNEALYQYNGVSKKGDGVKKRQVQEDLKFMESEEGYRMIIDAIYDGHKKYYRYHHRNDSISERPFNQEELNIVSDAMMLLKRFEGIPQFSWVQDIEKQMYSTSQLGKNVRSVVSFQHNPYLKGMDKDYYKQIFDAIVNKQAIEITYHPFGKDAKPTVVSPYHLKQYNNRWYILGSADTDKKILTFALDRIDKVTPLPEAKFIPCQENLSERFEDIVGVTLYEERSIEHIVFWVSDQSKDYIDTKPLHGSQTLLRGEKSDQLFEKYPHLQHGAFFSIDCIPNYELIRELCSYGKDLQDGILLPMNFIEDPKEEENNTGVEINPGEEILCANCFELRTGSPVSFVVYEDKGPNEKVYVAAKTYEVE